MKQIHSSRLIIFLVAMASVILVSFSVLFIRLEMKRRSANIEYQVFQVMTGIIETWTTDSSFDPAQWPDVTGFGIYRASGLPLYQYGTAPAYLDGRKSSLPQALVSGSGSTMIMVRKLGAIPPMNGEMGMGFMNFHPPEEERVTPPEPDGRMNGMGSPNMGAYGLAESMRGAGGRFAFIEINVAPLVREGWFVITSVLVALALFFGIIFLVVLFARKLQQYRIREQESAHLVQLGSAARTLAHEIKNPLGVIRVQCATLRRTVPQERLGNIGVIEEETARLVTLADRIRDFLQTSKGNPRTCDAGVFLDRCRERYDGRILVPDTPADGALVFIDSDRMMQILDNLIANALDASEGKEVLPELFLSVQRTSVLYSVSDSGCGIDPANRSRLFEPFFTTKARGSGIGLALARRFAEQAGGSLLYSPRSGGGSVFTLVLPRRYDL